MIVRGMTVRIGQGTIRKLQKGKMMKKKRKKKWNVNRGVFIVTGIALPILSFLIFWVSVNLNTLLLAFQEPRTGIWTLENFKTFWDELTSSNGDINVALRNTVIYFALNIVMLFVNLFVAYFLYKKIFMYKIFRVVFYLPAIVSSVILTSVFSEFIKPQGPLGAIMNRAGHSLPVEGLLGRADTATWTIVAYCVWTGFVGMLMFHGSLARVPVDVIEAAKLDGCGPFRELVSIIFPLIWPMFTTLLIFQMTTLFTASGPILLFDSLNQYQTQTVSFWIFRQVYGSGQMGGSGNYGVVSAAGLCFTAVGLPVILLVRKLIEKVPAVEY